MGGEQHHAERGHRRFQHAAPGARLDAVRAVGCAIVDWASDSRLSDPSNTAYYNADGVHPNDAGALVMAQLADVVLAP